MQHVREPGDGLQETATAPGPDPVPRRFDPWVVVVAAVASGTYLLHGFQGLFSRDLGVYAYGARQVLAGQPPYVGSSTGPGRWRICCPVPGHRGCAAGRQRRAARDAGWYMVLAVACVVLTYVVGVELFGSRAAGLAAAATMLSFQGFIDLATTGPREKTPMVLFIVCAIWALSHRRWLWTGVSISLATLTLQITFLPLLAAAVVAIVLVGPGRRVRDLARLIVGGAIPAVVLAVYFAAYGALGDLLDGFVLLNARYSHGRPFSSRAGLLWGRLQEGYGASLWLLLGGLVLVLAITVLRVVDRTRRRDPVTVTMVALAVATVGSLVWNEVDFDSYEDAFPLLPLAALGIGAAIAELELRLPRRAALAVAVPVVVIPVVLAAHYSVTARDHQLAGQQAATKALLAQVPNARIWSLDAPQYLVLAERANPTRYQLLSGGLGADIDARWPGGMDAFVSWNLAQQPDLIAVNGHELAVGHWTSRLKPDYVRVGYSAGAFWFARTSLGKDVLRALRADAALLPPVRTH